MRVETPAPFALSLSKGFPSFSRRGGQDFDRLSPNGSVPLVETS
jgi:hypothetical protein